MTDKQDRQINILLYLKENRQAKAAELAGINHVSRTTIEHDLQDLSRAHYPICTETGRNGRIFVPEGCEIEVGPFRSDEEAFLRSLLPGLQPEQQKKMEEILRNHSHFKYL